MNRGPTGEGADRWPFCPGYKSGSFDQRVHAGVAAPLNRFGDFEGVTGIAPHRSAARQTAGAIPFLSSAPLKLSFPPNFPALIIARDVIAPATTAAFL